MNSGTIFSILWPLYRKVLPDDGHNYGARDCAAHAAMMVEHRYDDSSLEETLQRSIRRARGRADATFTDEQMTALINDAAAALLAAGHRR